MSFLQEELPTLDAMRASVMAETQTAAMLSSQIEQQGRSFWDNIFSITIYSFAIVASSRALNSSTFFTLLMIFGGLMYVIVHIKAYLVTLLATRQQQYPVHGRSFLEMLSQVLTLILVYVNYRLVRMITMRSDASIMDGIFHVENLILPALLFVLFYVVWHINAMRHKAMPLQ